MVGSGTLVLSGRLQLISPSLGRTRGHYVTFRYA
jgi:hypothetical protein